MLPSRIPSFHHAPMSPKRAAFRLSSFTRGWLTLCSALVLLCLAPQVSTAKLFYKVEKTVRLTDLNPNADGTVPMSVT